MEAIINIMTASFTFLVIIFVEKVLPARPITKQQVLKYQQALSSKSEKENGPDGMIVTLLYAKNQLKEIRDDNKMYMLILSGVILFVGFVALEFLGLASNDNICFLTISAIALICYAIVEVSGSMPLAITLYCVLFIANVIFHICFKNILMLSTDSFLYSVILIITIMVCTFFRKAEEE